MRRAGGFTLIEIVVTMAIVGILASIALPSTRMIVQHNKEKDLKEGLRQIRDALDRYKEATIGIPPLIAIPLGGSGYPPSLDVLAKGVTDKDGKTIYFLRRIPRDPFCNCPRKDPEETWGLRSYKSAPDSPQDGDDVFDVYSLSRGIGLNGIPYKDW